MLAKNYHYDYYCIEALISHHTTTYDGRVIPNLIANSAYPISNGKEIIDAFVDMGASILTVLKNQGLDLRDQKNPQVNESIKKYLVQALSNLKMQLVLEDGYKCIFIQNNKGLPYFNLKDINKFDPYQNKLIPVKPYMLGGIDLSQLAPELWTPKWIALQSV